MTCIQRISPQSNNKMREKEVHICLSIDWVLQAVRWAPPQQPALPASAGAAGLEALEHREEGGEGWAQAGSRSLPHPQAPVPCPTLLARLGGPQLQKQGKQAAAASKLQFCRTLCHAHCIWQASAPDHKGLQAVTACRVKHWQWHGTMQIQCTSRRKKGGVAAQDGVDSGSID